MFLKFCVANTILKFPFQTVKIWQKLLCKVDSLFWRVNFFPPNFPFPKYKRKIWREKFTLQKSEFLLQRNEVLKISLFKLPKFPVPNCQISFSKLLKFPFPNCRNFEIKPSLPGCQRVDRKRN